MTLSNLYPLYPNYTYERYRFDSFVHEQHSVYKNDKVMLEQQCCVNIVCDLFGCNVYCANISVMILKANYINLRGNHLK